MVTSLSRGAASSIKVRNVTNAASGWQLIYTKGSTTCKAQETHFTKHFQALLFFSKHTVWLREKRISMAASSIPQKKIPTWFRCCLRAHLPWVAIISHCAQVCFLMLPLLQVISAHEIYTRGNWNKMDLRVICIMTRTWWHAPLVLLYKIFIAALSSQLRCMPLSECKTWNVARRGDLVCMCPGTLVLYMSFGSVIPRYFF